MSYIYLIILLSLHFKLSTQNVISYSIRQYEYRNLLSEVWSKLQSISFAGYSGESLTSAPNVKLPWSFPFQSRNYGDINISPDGSITFIINEDFSSPQTAGESHGFKYPSYSKEKYHYKDLRLSKLGNNHFTPEYVNTFMNWIRCMWRSENNKKDNSPIDISSTISHHVSSISKLQIMLTKFQFQSSHLYIKSNPIMSNAQRIYHEEDQVSAGMVDKESFGFSWESIPVYYQGANTNIDSNHPVTPCYYMNMRMLLHQTGNIDVSISLSAQSSDLTENSLIESLDREDMRTSRSMSSKKNKECSSKETDIVISFGDWIIDESMPSSGKRIAPNTYLSLPLHTDIFKESQRESNSIFNNNINKDNLIIYKSFRLEPNNLADRIINDDTDNISKTLSEESDVSLKREMERVNVRQYLRSGKRAVSELSKSQSIIPSTMTSSTSPLTAEEDTHMIMNEIKADIHPEIHGQFLQADSSPTVISEMSLSSDVSDMSSASEYPLKQKDISDEKPIMKEPLAAIANENKNSDIETKVFLRNKEEVSMTSSDYNAIKSLNESSSVLVQILKNGSESESQPESEFESGSDLKGSVVVTATMKVMTERAGQPSTSQLEAVTDVDNNENDSIDSVASSNDSTDSIISNNGGAANNRPGVEDKVSDPQFYTITESDYVATVVISASIIIFCVATVHYGKSFMHSRHMKWRKVGP